MRHDDLFLWYLGDPAAPRPVGALKLVASGKGVSLRYDTAWLDTGFALSEDLPLVDIEHLPAGSRPMRSARWAPSTTRGRTAGARRSSASSTSPGASP